MEQTVEFIHQITGDKTADKLTLKHFEDFFYPILIDKVLSTQDNDAFLRKMFKEADTDFSGYLSVDELYGVMLKMKIELTYQELMDLVLEYDKDGNAELDVDEFVELMTGGGDQTYEDETIKKNFSKLQAGVTQNQFDFAEILKQFATMPEHFVDSFFEEMKIKPSDRLRVTIDPSTFTFRDMVPKLDGKIDGLNHGAYLANLVSELACEITLEPTVGVPIPPEEFTKKGETIIRRAVRIGLYDNDKKELVFNTAMVTAEWNTSEPGEWKFANAQNPVLFRSTSALTGSKLSFIFELVIYVRNNESGRVK